MRITEFSRALLHLNNIESCLIFFFFFFFFFLYSIKNLQDELPITIPTNYSTKHYKDDNTTGSSRL